MKTILSLLMMITTLMCTAEERRRFLADSLAAPYLKSQTGALAIGIVNDGKTSIYYYGETKEGNKIKPDSTSIFEIGELTETFTSILLANLSISHDVRIDDKLNKHLPVDVPAPVYQQMVCRPVKSQSDQIVRDPRTQGDLQIHLAPFKCVPDSMSIPQPILLIYLANHTSGFPDIPSNLKCINKNDPYAQYSKNDLYDFLRNYTVEKPIGFEYKLSKVGIAILGHALSLKMKKEYEPLLTERILTPIQMEDTKITLNAEQQKRFLQGYSASGNPVSHWTSDIFAPAIGLRSSPADMMKFLKANISIKKDNINDVLDYSHNPNISTQINDKEMELALGWKVSVLNDELKKMVWQEGHTAGFSSFIGFVETTHNGVFILSANEKSVTGIGRELLKKVEDIKTN